MLFKNKKKLIKYLVIGAGRSGTGYMAHLLNSHGITCGHESIFGYPPNLKKYLKSMCNSKYEADSSWLAVPFIQSIIETNPDIKFIHITRHPVDVIKSFVELDLFNPKNEKSHYVKLIKKYSRSVNDTQVEHAIAYYIDWLNMIDDARLVNRLTIKLEEVDFKGLSEFIGKEISDFNTVVNSKASRKINKVDKSQLLNQIKNSERYSELKEVGKRYGYEI